MSTADSTSSDGSRTMRRVTRFALVATIAMVGLAAAGVAAESGCRAKFEQLDTNHDGVIDETEFDINKVSIIFLHADPDTGAIRFEKTTMLSRRVFDELDINHDGVIDISEVANAPAFQFAWWDRNGHGGVDWTEFQAGCGELHR